MEKPGLIRYLKLPFEFSEAQLVKELETILTFDWVPHFNTYNYEGDWQSIALYAVNGDANNIFALNTTTDAPIQETPILQNCPYLKSVIQTFKCPLLSVRLLRLNVGAYIKPHRDYELGYEDNCFRLHIPIVTNSQVKFILDEERVIMQAGECWYTNVNFVHSVANEGDCDRIHLVIDGQRNTWSDHLFFSLAPKEQLLTPPKENYDASTLNRIIEELQKQPSAETKNLIQQLRSLRKK